MNLLNKCYRLRLRFQNQLSIFNGYGYGYGYRLSRYNRITGTAYLVIG
jgi:hypothetical protein